MKNDISNIPDPNTPEGMAEINRRIKRIEDMSKGDVERAKANADSEPTGQLTNPCELDLWRGALRDED